MFLRKRRPLPCDRPGCPRKAVVACSMGPQSSNVCSRHVAALEHRWGQVFLRGLR